MNRASDTGNHLLISDDCMLPDSGSEQQVAALITVLGNLIDNALDALGPSAEGEVSVLLHYQKGFLACEVSDDGPGIAASQLEAIFEKVFLPKAMNGASGCFW